MAVYIFECVRCGTRTPFEAPMGEVPTSPICECGGELRRSYRSEGISVAVANLKRERDPRYRDSLFLPTAEDYMSPQDPDGSKGLREWNESNRPKEGNKAPRRPKVPKAVW